MRRILIIGPNDSADRIARVAHALAAQRPGLVLMTPTEIMDGERRWRDAYREALKLAAAVVCVPRRDATIGNGTLHDLVQAYEGGVAVRIVCPRGRLRALEEAGLEVIPKQRSGEANVGQKRTAWFSWTAKALPEIFGKPGPQTG